MDLTRRTFSALTFGALAAPELARAQTRGGAAIIELFTSQGCSSCPPADALMVELAGQKGIIPLTYPVEIWDYLGWKDTLARPSFTKRQRAYAAMVAGKRVYTPQAIVNGRAHCVGSDKSAISRLKSSTDTASGASIRLSAVADGWSAIADVSAGTAHARMLLLPLTSRQEVQIGRGENSGRTITYANVVRDIIDLGLLEVGEKSFQITRKDISTSKADGFALLIQSGSLEAPGAVLAGAIVDQTGIRA
jgi:hypothetical protein